MVNAYTLKDTIANLLDEVYLSEMANFDKAALLIKETATNNHKIVFFGQGHSVWVGNDLIDDYPINLISAREISKDAKEIYEYYGIKSEDLIVIVSNSGINPLVIDVAIVAKNNGNKIIVITSNKHTLIAPSRHLSKTKLYQYADVVIDNCCKYGDVALSEEDDELFSLSSIVNNTIAHTIIQKALREEE